MDVNQKARLLTLLRDCTEHIERSDDFAPVLHQTLSALQEHTFLCQGRLMTSMQHQIIALQTQSAKTTTDTKKKTVSEATEPARAPKRRRKVQTPAVVDPSVPYGTCTIPATYRFPTSLLPLWIHWCIPNNEEKIPALKDLKKSNFKGLEEEPNQRPVRKDYSDVKFICDFVENTALDAGFTLNQNSQWSEAKAREAFDFAYDTIYEVHPLTTRELTMHANWKTFIKKLRLWTKGRSMKRDEIDDE